jgi:hypothetical protein
MLGRFYFALRRTSPIVLSLLRIVAALVLLEHGTQKMFDFPPMPRFGGFPGAPAAAGGTGGAPGAAVANPNAVTAPAAPVQARRERRQPSPRRARLPHRPSRRRPHPRHRGLPHRAGHKVARVVPAAAEADHRSRHG